MHTLLWTHIHIGEILCNNSDISFTHIKKFIYIKKL